MSTAELCNDDYEVEYRVTYRPCAEARTPNQRNIMQRRSYLSHRTKKTPGHFKGLHQRRRRRGG